MIEFIGKILLMIKNISERFICKYQISNFKKRGSNSRIEGVGKFSYKNISVGSNVFIGSDSIFLSSEAEIIIGSNVMFGPHVMIISGDHRLDVLGKFMIDVTEKLPENDQDVIIEDDVWIGAGTIILKGVKIGRGSVIGAGSIVTKTIPPYSIFIGNTTKRLKSRFTKEEIILHEKILAIGDKMYE